MSLYEYEKIKTGKYSIGWIDIRKNKLDRFTTDETIEYLGLPTDILYEKWSLNPLPKKEEYNYFTVNRSNAMNTISKMMFGLEPLNIDDLVENVKVSCGIRCQDVYIEKE